MGKEKDGYSCGLYCITAMRKFCSSASKIPRVGYRTYDCEPIEEIRQCRTAMIVSKILRCHDEGVKLNPYEVFVSMSSSVYWGSKMKGKSRDEMDTRDEISFSSGEITPTPVNRGDGHTGEDYLKEKTCHVSGDI